MQALTFSDFAPFFREVHQYDPFPWQMRLLEHVLEKDWPAIIDVPTGSGKTACIDIALFALAIAPKRFSRRIAMVVDRRVVVDQAAERARKLARALRASCNPVSLRVASQLASLSSENVPLRVAVLRGGIPRDSGWARTPDQPLVIASTVDQVGSRLLFRGYGVSPSMAPVHAGLIGNDTLFLLDEVHLSRPFQETLEAISNRLAGSRSLPNRFRVASLSATPGTTAVAPFRLKPTERTEGVLGQRLLAKKLTRLRECDRREGLVEAAVETAAELRSRGHLTIGVVVNRVQTAHEVVRGLRERYVEGNDTEVVLLTGRMRPLDRDDRVRSIEPRVAAVPGRRKQPGAPLIVVGTQCIEAGADFDFDALISELASFDSLRQRFGRVDRLGEYGRAEGVVIAVKDPNEKGVTEIPKDDPIYSGALQACWKILQALIPKKTRVIDFGVEALDAAVGSRDISAALSPKPSAPVFLPRYLELWAQTSPRPIVEPDVPLFLHGPKGGPPDLQVVWRLDLDDDDAWIVGDGETSAIGRVAAVPPSSLEAVSIPYGIARRWLASEHEFAESMTDVEGGVAPRGSRRERQRAEGNVRAVVWRGDKSFAIRRAEDIDDVRPGDTVVVPSSRGGLFDGSFDPTKLTPASDLAERASLVARGRAVLRLNERVLNALGMTVSDDGYASAQPEAPQWITLLARGLKNARRIVVDDSLTVLRGRGQVEIAELQIDAADDETTDDEVSSYSGQPISLARHSKDVEEWARRFATNLGLDRRFVEVVAFAGWLHDVGKADPRFQRLLRDGSEISILVAQKKDPEWELAKSGMGPNERHRAREAATKSGYPKGARHELLSLAMIQDSADLQAEARKRCIQEDDVALVFHLVSSHHGWCRPFAPAIVETAPEMEVHLNHGGIALRALAGHCLDGLESPIPDRFFRLGERHGWLPLAWLEALLRLADHRASEIAQEEDSGNA